MGDVPDLGLHETQLGAKLHGVQLATLEEAGQMETLDPAQLLMVSEMCDHFGHVLAGIVCREHPGSDYAGVQAYASREMYDAAAGVALVFDPAVVGS
jgi:hypothetical protein